MLEKLSIIKYLNIFGPAWSNLSLGENLASARGGRVGDCKGAGRFVLGQVFAVGVVDHLQLEKRVSLGPSVLEKVVDSQYRYDNDTI